MTRDAKRLRCAIYTRVSTEHGLEQDFNSLDAQREAAEAYIKSQAHEGWTLIRAGYDAVRATALNVTIPEPRRSETQPKRMRPNTPLACIAAKTNPAAVSESPSSV